jgi:hypothetical protein
MILVVSSTSFLLATASKEWLVSVLRRISSNEWVQWQRDIPSGHLL